MLHLGDSLVKTSDISQMLAQKPRLVKNLAALSASGRNLCD